MTQILFFFEPALSIKPISCRILMFFFILLILNPDQFGISFCVALGFSLMKLNIFCWFIVRDAISPRLGKGTGTLAGLYPGRTHSTETRQLPGRSKHCFLGSTPHYVCLSWNENTPEIITIFPLFSLSTHGIREAGTGTFGSSSRKVVVLYSVTWIRFYKWLLLKKTVLQCNYRFW